MSVQSELTFIEAKNFCIGRLHHFIDFANQMFGIFPSPSLMLDIIHIETLFERVKTASYPRLFKMEIGELAHYG
jgi:hypothetical protein